MSAIAGEQLRALMWATAAFGGGIALHVDRVPIWATAAALGCMAWCVLAGAGKVRTPRPSIRIALMLALISAVYSQFHTLNGLDAGTVLLIAMGAIKLFEIKSRRDHGIVVGVALVLLLAACLDRQSLGRAPLYLLHAWLCCAAFAINAQDGRGITNKGAIALAGRSLLLALPLAVLMFLFFPRVAGSFWALPHRSQAMTGLAETMSPGSISELTESAEPAFRVAFTNAPPPPEERYWRGPVLHDFDGYTWRRSPGRFYREDVLEYLGKAYSYRITLEPHANRWWFALDTVRAAPERGVFLTYDRQLFAAEPVTRQTTYEAVSHTRVRSVGSLSILGRRYDTALPMNRNPRTLSLARALYTKAGSDVAYMQAVLQMFREQGFEYTLTPPRLDYDSVDDFLFNTRRGFCGHYASAFTTLMRAAGLPARVVTGYLGGEWNPIGGFYIVRQSDAHAWGEVWLEGRGWTRVDPTAVVAPERLRRGIFDLIPNAGTVPQRLMHGFEWLAQLRQSWDAVNAWWDESVVRFDLRKQLDILRALGVNEPDWRQLGWAFATALILWLTWIAWHVGYRFAPRPQDPLTRAYAKLCDKLAKSGVARLAHQGPLDYADSLAAQRPDVAAMARPLLERYANLRFGIAKGTHEFEQGVARLRIPKLRATLSPERRTELERAVPLYRRMPTHLRAQLEPVALRFAQRARFVGCNGLAVTEHMQLVVAIQACMLIFKRDPSAYDALSSVLIYPDEFLVSEQEEDEAGVVTEGTRVLSGQTFGSARIILSWRDVLASSSDEEAYNVVLHEFAHFLDHEFGGALTEIEGSSRALASWRDVLTREYEALSSAVDEDTPTLMDAYGAEHPAEFFAVATETFFERSGEMRRRHRELYDKLLELYGVDPASWG